MLKEVIRTDQAPQAIGTYSQAVKCGGTVFLSGQIPLVPRGERSEVLWYDGNDNVWHDRLKKSDGLKPQPRKEVALSTLRQDLQALYEEFLPHYQHLHEYRLSADRSGHT